MCALRVATCLRGVIKSVTRMCALSCKNLACRFTNASKSDEMASAFLGLIGTGTGFFVSGSMGKKDGMSELFGASMMRSSSANVLKIKSKPCINQNVSAMASQS